jgi:sarcosine oxidase subunit gamma
MSDWSRHSPLQSCSGGPLDGPGLELRELPHSSKLLLQARGDIEAIQRAVSSVLGQDLPVTANSSSISTNTVLWLAPRKWLIIFEHGDITAVQRQLKEALAGMPCLVSEVSDARFGIQVSGANARRLLAKVCALDLDPKSFIPGDCAQSQLVRVPLLLHQVDEIPTYHLFVDRSLAKYAWDWLSDAAEEFTTLASTT